MVAHRPSQEVVKVYGDEYPVVAEQYFLKCIFTEVRTKDRS
jgi:hypothetical protein